MPAFEGLQKIIENLATIFRNIVAVFKDANEFVFPEDSGFDTQDDSAAAAALLSKRARKSAGNDSNCLVAVDESFLKMMLSLMKDVPSSVKNKFQADMFAAIYRLRGQYIAE